jgi:hypothetical protein
VLQVAGQGRGALLQQALVVEARQPRQRPQAVPRDLAVRVLPRIYDEIRRVCNRYIESIN